MRDKQITDKEARQRIAGVLETAGQPEAAAKMVDREYTQIEFKSGVWADEAMVHIDRRWEGSIGEGEAKQVVVSYRVQVNWSSTHRSVANALTAIANYQKAVTLAAQIEALVESFPTVVVGEE